jgi:hypothetical protein
VFLWGDETLIVEYRKLDTRRLREDIQLSGTYTSEASRRVGSTIMRFRNIIFRIGRTTSPPPQKTRCDTELITLRIYRPVPARVVPAQRQWSRPRLARDKTRRADETCAFAPSHANY